MATTLERPTAAQTQPPAPLSSPPTAAPDQLNPFRWIIAVAVLTGAFLELLDTTSINVALRQMAGTLSATPDEIAWVVTGYILSNVIVLPMTAWLSGLFGRRKYLTFSILLFTVASILCGTSHTLVELVFWRIVQGAGGAALLSTAQTTLREVFPKNQQGMIQSLYIVVVVIGPTLGPTFGGWITDNYSWPWIFFIKAPIGFIAAFLVWKYLADSVHVQVRQKVDWAGIGLMTVGLGALQYVLEEGERYDWLNDTTIARLTFLAAVTLIAFVAWELSPRNVSPVVNLRVLRHRDLTAGLILLSVGGFGIYGATYILPLFVQQILGFSPTTTGLIFLPGGLAAIVSTVMCGRLLNGDKPLAKPPILIFLGMSGFALSMWMLGQMTPDSGEAQTQLGLIVRGASLGLLLTPITVAALSGLKGIEIAQGAGLSNLFRQLGGSFGIAAINTYVVRMTDFHRANLLSNIASSNQGVGSRQIYIAHYLTTHGFSPTSASNMAFGLIDHAVQVQSQLMAYNNAFLLIGLTFLIALPAVLMFRTRKAVAGPPPAAH